MSQLFLTGWLLSNLILHQMCRKYFLLCSEFTNHKIFSLKSHSELYFIVQAGTPKPAKPQQQAEEEPMEATSQAEGAELSAERYATDVSTAPSCEVCPNDVSVQPNHGFS